MQPVPTDTRKERLLSLLSATGPLLGLILLCLLGALLNPDFATLDNLLNVLTRTAFIGIIAVGMTFVIMSGGIDLSVGAMAALIAGAMILIKNRLLFQSTSFDNLPASKSSPDAVDSSSLTPAASSRAMIACRRRSVSTEWSSSPCSAFDTGSSMSRVTP